MLVPAGERGISSKHIQQLCQRSLLRQVDRRLGTSNPRAPTTFVFIVRMTQTAWKGVWIVIFSLGMVPYGVAGVYEEQVFDKYADASIGAVVFWPTFYSAILFARQLLHVLIDL